MHYLVVAKVKDYPNFNELENSLMYIEPASSDRWGDWEEIAANVEEFSESNKDDIMRRFNDENMSFEDKVLAYIDENRFRVGDDGKVYEKISAHFDYCVLGGRFATNKVPSVTTYNKVCEEYGEVAAFVLPTYDEDDKREYKYDLYYIEEDSCDFEPDDLVYVIDGHN